MIVLCILFIGKIWGGVVRKGNQILKIWLETDNYINSYEKKYIKANMGIYLMSVG